MAVVLWVVRWEAMWDALKLLFGMVVTNERYHRAKIMNDGYKDPQNKLFVPCGRKVLKEVVSVIKLFQAENANVTKLMKDLLYMYRNLLLVATESRLLQKNWLEGLPTPRFLDYLMPYCFVQFGREVCTAAVNGSLSEPQLSYVKKRRVLFVTELIREVQKRFHNSFETLFQLHQLQRKNATAMSKERFLNTARHLLIWIS